MNDVRSIANVAFIVMAFLDILMAKVFGLSHLFFFIPCGILAFVVGLFCFIITLIKDMD